MANVMGRRGTPRQVNTVEARYDNVRTDRSGGGRVERCKRYNLDKNQVGGSEEPSVGREIEFCIYLEIYTRLDVHHPKPVGFQNQGDALLRARQTLTTGWMPHGSAKTQEIVVSRLPREAPKLMATDACP